MILFIYLLSLSAIFLPFAAFKIIGVFVLFCFLPGFCLLSYRKKTIEFVDLIMSFPCSIGISTILIMIMLYLGVSVFNISIILSATAGAAVLTCVISARRSKTSTTIALSRKELTFCTVALLMTVLLSLPILLGSDRVPISYHGFFHSALTSQILQGTFPPEGPGLGGVTINYPWGFHSLVAALSAHANLHPLKIISIVNMLSLFMIFCFGYYTAGLLGFPERYRYLVPLAMLGLMHSDGGIFFIKKAISGNLPSLKDLPDLQFPLGYYKIFAWSPKLPDIWFDNRLLFLSKFYNATNMPLSICLSLSYFLILLHLLKGGFFNRKVYLILLGIVIAAGVLIYLPLAIIPLLHAPIWSCFILASAQGTVKEKLRETSEIFLPYTIAVIAVTPYLLFVLSSVSLSKGEAITFDIYIQSFRNLIVFWLSVPVIIFGVQVAIRRLTYSRTLFFLIASSLLILCLAVFMRLPERASYKFSYILTFFFALFFVFSLSEWLPKINNLWLKGFITICISVLLLFTPVLIEASYIISPWFRDNTYSLSGRYIEFAEERERNMAYKWIRENTPRESLIMLSYVEPPVLCCADNSAYRPAALAERNLFVIRDDAYTVKDPEYLKRIHIREQLFENPGNPQLSNYFTSLNRPVYLMVEDDFRLLPDGLEKRFPLRFHNDRQRIYLVHDRP